MKRVEASARISAAPADVFAFLADLDNLADWQTGIVTAEQTSPGEVTVGSTARVVRELMGSQIEAPLTITEYDPPLRLAIASEVSGVKALAQLDLAEADGETDLAFAMEIRGSLLTAFMEPIIAGAARSEVDASLARIQARFASAPAA